MPFPYELYPKAKETHCLNLPEISVSRPPFPGSIRTADGCFWGERDNNSYVSSHKTDKVCSADGKCYDYSEVFVDEVAPGHSDTCSQICYVACSCNTSNGWYSSCQGSDCISVTDTRYAGQPNAASASRSLSDVTSISASGANSGISASAAAKSGLKTASAAGNYTATAASAGLKTASAAAAATGATSGISTLVSGATTCYKKKTCSEGGYYDSVPAGKKCPEVAYNGYTCYDTNCTNACPDGYFDTRPTLDATQSKYMEIHENNDGCYNIQCKSGYSNFIREAFAWKESATYTSSIKNITCGTHVCADNYEQVSGSLQCSSGVDYNGKIWCCPSDNKTDYYPGEAFYTVKITNSPYPGTNVSLWIPNGSLTADMEKSDSQVLAGAGKGSIRVDLSVSCTASCNAGSNGHMTFKIRVGNGSFANVGVASCSCNQFSSMGYCSILDCSCSPGNTECKSCSYSNGTWTGINNQGTKFHYSM